MYGHTDVPLADNFETESRLVLAAIEEVTASARPRLLEIHSSPLSRCSLLAERLRLGLQSDPLRSRRIDATAYDDRLKEMNFGDWENRHWSDVSAEGGEEWGNNWQTMSTPNGESFDELYSRATGFLDDLLSRLRADVQLKKQTPKLALIVTHSGVLRCLHAYVNGLSRAEAFHFNPPYGSVIRLI